MAILKLRDEGQLSLDDPAERYVPDMCCAATGPDRPSHFKTKCFPQTESPERSECGEWRGILTDRELLNRG